MLSAMRSTAHSFVMKALMVFLVISFGVWGVGDILRSNHRSDLARVGGERVDYPEFARATSQTERMMEAMGVTNVPHAALQEQVLRRLIEEKMVKQRLHDAGLEVNEDLLAARLREAPTFHNVKGEFDPTLFKATLAQRGMNETRFLDDLRADIRAALFTASLSTDGMSPPPAVAALYAQAGGERRSAVVVTIPASAVAVTAPDEAALKAYYDQNKELLYMQPERRTLNYVAFTPKDLEALAAKEVTPEAVADRVGSDPERYKDEQVARDELKTEAKEQVADHVTTAIEDALAAGDSMEAAVKKAGITAPVKTLSDVTANAPSKDPLIQAVSAKGFTLEQGDTSTIETTPQGLYYMVSAAKVTAAEPKPYDTVAADVKIHALQRARSKALRAKAEELKTALEKSDDWRATAKQFGASAREVNGIVRPEDGKASGLSAPLAEAVFEHDSGGVAGPLVSDSSAELAKVTGVSFVKIDAKPDAKTLAALRKDVQQEVLDNYYRALTEHYPVTVNQRMMQEIQAQEGGGA